MNRFFSRLVLTFVVFSLSANLIYSQDKNLSIIYKSDFYVNERLVLSKENIKKELYQNYNVETPFWETDETSSIVNSIRHNTMQFIEVLHPKKGKNNVIITTESNGLIRVHPLRKARESLAELENYSYSELPLQLYFSEVFFKKLDELKPISDLTKPDLITAIKFTHSYEKLVVDFGKIENLQNFFLFKISENLFHYKLYTLGYNPYKLPEEGNYIDKFKGDEDVKSLFKPENIFKLRIN